MNVPKSRFTDGVTPRSAWFSRSAWVGGVLVGIIVTAIATGAGFALEDWLERPDVGMMQLLGILVVAMRFPVGPAVASAVLSVLSFDFFFIPPRYAFAWTDAKSSITFVVMVITGGVVSHVNQKLRREQRRAAVRERTTAALYRLLSDLGAARSLPHAEAIASRDLSELFGAPVFVLVANGSCLGTPGLTGDDKSDADECWRTLTPVQRRARSHDDSIWVPIICTHRPIGVLGVRGASPAPDIERLNRATADQCAQVVATAVERIELAEAARGAELRVEVEQLRNSLLSAVSHDIRTPLASIIAAGAMLAEVRPNASADERRRLASTVVEEAERLTRLTENLLELARLRTGHVVLKREAVPVDELIEAALRRLRSRLRDRQVSVDVPEHCPMVSVDRLLIEQVMVNLLENASKYARDESIEISVSYDRESVTMGIADRGPGLPPGEEERIFERFYRGANAETPDGGLGLGLTIARTIVESHGGMIRLENRGGGGAVARVRLSRAHDVDEAASSADHHSSHLAHDA
jgi:two-component system sensor histidine kinase KdpD